jgi:peptidoglycan/xylan/chitin deacetylase (PgdA/CDA1 family)
LSSRGGSFALTFDDGPDPVWTGRVLVELERWAATATFFLDARRALEHPAMVAAIRDGGHEIGLHCFEHVRHSELGEEEVAADVLAALRALASVGVQPHAWRTPWGVETEATRRVAAARDLCLVGWNRDSHDWRGDSSEEMLAGIEAEGGLGDGAVILMHDGIGPGAEREGCGETVRLTEALLARAREHELRPVAISQLDPAAPQAVAR